MRLTGKSNPQFFSARFLYGGVRQADKVKGRQTGRKVTFHFHFERVHAEKSHAECF